MRAEHVKETLSNASTIVSQTCSSFVQWVLNDHMFVSGHGQGCQPHGNGRSESPQAQDEHDAMINSFELRLRDEDEVEDCNGPEGRSSCRHTYLTRTVCDFVCDYDTFLC